MMDSSGEEVLIAIYEGVDFLDPKRAHAFVDESGTFDLEVGKPGNQDLYVAVAVIVRDKNLDQAEAAMLNISKSKFGGAPIESKNFRGERGRRRRLEVLEQVQEIPFTYFALIVDKARIDRNSGLQYKPTFYKYFSRMMYSRLLEGHTSLSITADFFGGSNFMDGVGPYLRQMGKPDLFSSIDDPKFANVDSEPLLQLADLIAGSLVHAYDKSKRIDKAITASYRDLLEPKSVDRIVWPPDSDSIPLPTGQTTHPLDPLISRHNLERAAAHAEKFWDSELPERRMQSIVLHRLLFAATYEENNDRRSITRAALIQHLEERGFEISERQFGSKILGRLRHEGILFTGTEKGYKITMSVADTDEYLMHNLSILRPMMNKVRTARRVVKSLTHNEYDILDREHFSQLKDWVERQRDSELDDLGIVEPTSSEGEDAY